MLHYRLLWSFLDLVVEESCFGVGLPLKHVIEGPNEDLFEGQPLIRDSHEGLNTVVEIAAHEVNGTNIDIGVHIVMLNHKDTIVLEITAHDATDIQIG